MNINNIFKNSCVKCLLKRSDLQRRSCILSGIYGIVFYYEYGLDSNETKKMTTLLLNDVCKTAGIV
jgi:hypothetical protein